MYTAVSYLSLWHRLKNANSVRIPWIIYHSRDTVWKKINSQAIFKIDIKMCNCWEIFGRLWRPEGVRLWRPRPAGSRRAPFARLLAALRHQPHPLLLLPIDVPQKQQESGPPACGLGHLLVRRPRRPLLAAVLASSCVCWLLLLLVTFPLAPPHPLAYGSGAATVPPAAAFVFPPREGSLPDPASWRGLSDEQVSRLSILGRMLFLNDTKNLEQKNKTYTILIWKYGRFLENRHIKHFTNERYDPFENCSVRNCHIVYEDKYLSKADAIIFHLHLTENRNSLPQRNSSTRNQRWIFLTDENPHNTFLKRRNNVLKHYSGIFNWSMTYRMDSDVPVPYGRTIPLSKEEADQALKTVPKNYAAGKTGIVAIMGSNCGGTNKRWNYVHELQKHINVDVYGGCGTLKCPGGFRKDCPKIKNYKFYLVFENGNCREYITEKMWWNAFKNNAVPVVMGAPKENIRHFLPNKSYLHVEDFASPADLARFLIHLHRSDRDYNSYFQWKYKYKILNEHGYFQSPVYHYCRACEALNYNDPSEKVYDDLEKFWNAKTDCQR